MAVATVILRWFVGMMTEFTLYISYVGIVRIWYDLLGLFTKFGPISVTLDANSRGNLLLRCTLFMAALTKDTSHSMLLSQIR